MASLQARHTRACGRGWETFENAKGCGCKPTFFLRARDGGKLHSIHVGKNRKEAERALNRIAVEVDEGSFQAPRKITFTAWADEWIASLECRETTVDSYRSTVAYAVEAFGAREVQRIGVDDVRALNASMRERGLADSTRAKHLRVLGACLAAAIPAGYAARNPVRDLGRGQRPRARKRESAYFTNDEITRLVPEIPEGVYRVLVLTALGSGARLGELMALRWGDLDLMDATASIRRTKTPRGTYPTKTHEVRHVHLLGDLVGVLGRWWGELGEPDDQTLVFPGPARDGHLDPTTVTRRVLYGAMTRAGIERRGPTGENRTFHSLRHTHAKRVLEAGASITWLQRQLGHSSITVTVDVYGHWEDAARKQEAERLAEAFVL